VTTTKIYYSPPGQTGTARFDVPGSNVANVALTEVFSPAFAGGVNTYHTRNTNNYYTWICGNPDVAYANISMVNWSPAIGNLTLVDYTFPNGGGTLSATTSNISIAGQWLVNRFAITKVTGTSDAFYRFGLNSSPAYTGGDLIRVNQAGVIGDDPVWDNGPINTWQNSAIQTYSVTTTGTYIEPGADIEINYVNSGYVDANYFVGTLDGDYAADGYFAPGIVSTIQDVLFYANVRNQLANVAGAVTTTQANVLVTFEYTYSRSYEVNLHSATSSLSTKTNFASALAGLQKAAQSTATIDSTTQIITDFRLGGQSTATIDSTTQVDLAGVVFDAVATVQADANLAVQPGYLQAAAAAITAETALTESAQNIKGLNAVLVESATTQSVAENIIGISDGSGYIDTGYADLDYFLAGAGLTIAQNSHIVADANIIRSDGTILFEAAFDGVIQPGFRIDAGIITQAVADFEISPYTTAGTGILFAAAAALSAEATIAQALFGIAIDNVTAAAQVDSALQATSSTVILGDAEIALFDLALSSNSESRPSIRAEITIGDDGVLTATAFVDTSSRAELDIGSVEFGPAVGGYRVGAELEIVQEITSTFTTDARIFYIDMYYTSVVAAETRRYRVWPEARLFQPDPETRVNTNLEETRIFQVDPETRQADPAILPTQLRDSKLFRIPV